MGRGRCVNTVAEEGVCWCGALSGVDGLECLEESFFIAWYLGSGWYTVVVWTWC